jgi:tetratricopeptide (TPR) repeat protein
MSPEQADPNVQDIDTRTDVYSLGAVLYVLLAGIQPFETRQGKQPLDELLRKLREEEPPRPSTKVGADRETSTATAEARGIEPQQLVSLLRGDLDGITMKALEKDRTRRYGAPSELATDIQRYLNHEPVEARPASAGYRLRKYARRHRVAVGVVVGLVTLLAIFSVLQTLQLRRITRERDRANRERDRANREGDRANRITDFMAGMFKVSDPGEARGNTVTVREILDKASNDMGAGLAKDPQVQSQMMQVMARTYGNLGLYPRAHEMAKSALDSRLTLLGPDDPKTLESMTQMGWILEKEGHYAEAEKLERQALAGERRILGPGDPLTLETLGDLSFVVLGQHRFAEGGDLAREAIEVGSRTLGPDSAQVLPSVKNLGNALWYQGRYAEAEGEYRRLLDAERRLSGPDHPDTLTAMKNLALAIKAQGRFAEAEPLAREALTTAQRVLGPEHPLTISFLYNFAAILFEDGRLAEAEKLYREALAIQARTLGPEHPSTLITKAELSDDLFKEGQVHGAERLQRETLSARLRIFGPESRLTLLSQADLARTLNKEGRYAEAEKLAQGAFEAGIRAHELHSPVTLNALRQLGKAMAYSHRYPEAARLFRNLMEKDNDSAEQMNPGIVWYDFACAAAVANRPDEALQYLREALNRGYKGTNGRIDDDDLQNLRQNLHFQELVAGLKPPAAKAQTH